MIEFINIQPSKMPTRPYSTMVKAGKMVFISGTIGVDRSTGQMVEGGIETQTRQALQNIFEALEQSGLADLQVVKTTVFLTNIQDFEAMNAAYSEYFDRNSPARSTVGVKELPHPQALIEIEAIASTG